MTGQNYYPDGWTAEAIIALQHDVDDELRRARACTSAVSSSALELAYRRGQYRT
jgi:hypothetical protein